MRFESKRDPFIIWSLRGIPFLVVLVVGSLWYVQHGDIRGPLIGAVMIIAFEVFLFETILRSTYYKIDGDTLAVHSSFITWRVPIREITAITPTRSPTSSPALSLDRLRIDYAGKAILVSPEEKQRFIDALRAINPAIMRAT